MIKGLRDYQIRAIRETYSWLDENEGNPCIVAPTGSGKGWICAGFCEDLLKYSPDCRILVLSHVRELLTQNAEKLLQAWPNAPVSLYSAGLKSKEINAITIAGIQSVWKKSDELGIVDFIIVDEAHTISNTDNGMYRELIKALKSANPSMRVIGMTATPYRLGQGLLTEGKEAIFQALIEPVSIEELIKRGYLAKLTSTFTALHMNTDGIKKIQGDYDQRELEMHINTNDTNHRVVSETIERAQGRKSWLVFCAGIAHAEAMRDEFIAQGVNAAMITGKTPNSERTKIFDDFRAGKITALTNVGVATTGFDHPDIDVIVMARPTLSPGLYMQMSGRGMRIKSPGHPSDCLILDFADNITRHGPITKIIPPRRSIARKKKSEITLGGLFKTCPKCKKTVLKRLRECPHCGYVFKDLSALNLTADIMGAETTTANRMKVTKWYWKIIYAKKDKTPIIRVDFYGEDLLKGPIMMFLPMFHENQAVSEKAYMNLKRLLRGVKLPPQKEIMSLTIIHKLVEAVKDNFFPPAWIEYKQQGNYTVVTKWSWENEK